MGGPCACSDAHLHSMLHFSFCDQDAGLPYCYSMLASFLVVWLICYIADLEIGYNCVS